MRAGVRSTRSRDAHRDRAWARTGSGLLVPQSRWNSADKSASMTLSGNDLTVTKSAPGDQWCTLRSTVPFYGRKVYAEAAIAGSSSQIMFGIADIEEVLESIFVGVNPRSYSYYGQSGNKVNNNAVAAYGATYGNGDVIGMKFDGTTLSNGSIEFLKNNVSQGVAYTGVKGLKFLAASIYNGSSVASLTLHCRKGQLVYPLPSGYETVSGD